ncbi:MAG: hypothetical protein QM770_00640 [Tepidisphaeraceae bacterium]
MADYSCTSCGHRFGIATGNAQHCPRCGKQTLQQMPAIQGFAGGMPPSVAQPVLDYSSVQYGVVPRKSLKPYTICFWSGLGAIAFGIVSIIAAFAIDDRDVSPVLAVLGGIACFVGWGSMIAAMIMGFIVLYRGWTVAQPARFLSPMNAQMPTPGKAVGFMFIPFFNVYWHFVALPGLYQKLNMLLGQRGHPLRLPEGLATTAAILLACGVIPYLGLIPAFCGLILMYFVIRGVHQAIDVLA